MIVEMRSLYRGEQKSTGLEILIFGMVSLPMGSVEFVASDIDGEVVVVPAADVRLNWRWNPKTRDWDDVDMPDRPE